MVIINRNAESQFLEKVHQSSKSEFIAVYGRRRVGKTFLIRQVYTKQMIFECSGIHNGSMSQQLENFWQILAPLRPNTMTPPTSWIQAFDQLQKHLSSLRKRKKKKVIFLDEISWFDTTRSGFLGALSNFWNHYCTKRDDIILIICGSATSWLMDKVVNNTGGLHNRISQTIRLDPFTIKETKKYLNAYNIKLADKDLIQLYMCIGGIPHYLNGIRKGRSLAHILDDLFFNSNPTLLNEFDNLYAALFKNHEDHVKVIKALASKNKGLTRKEIIKLTKLSSGGGLTTILTELEQCGFIKKLYDFEKRIEDGLYRLIDEYSIFHLKFIHNKRKKLTGQSITTSQSFRSWSGFAFENFCFKHLPHIAALLGISGIEYQAHSFIDKGSVDSTGVQIDLIIDRADNVVNIIEIKFYSGIYKMTKVEAKKIQERINSFLRKTKTKQSIFTTLITVDGSLKNVHHLSTITNEITIAKLLK